EPPKVAKPFAIGVPQVNADGNETTGVRLPEQSVPLATYTGWNLRDPKIGAPQVIYNMVGSMIPFARTRLERQKSGDPRPSIEERYSGKEDYLKHVDQASAALVRTGLLLSADAAKIRAKAAARWDLLMSPTQ